MLMALSLSCANRAATRTAREAMFNVLKGYTYSYLGRMEKMKKAGTNERGLGDENNDSEDSATCQHSTTRLGGT